MVIGGGSPERGAEDYRHLSGAEHASGASVLHGAFTLKTRDCRGLRPFDSRPLVRRFRYCGEPLFQWACALYALNRWVLKPWIDSAFLRGHFNDVLLMPCALPPVLWVQRRLGIRKDDRYPDLMEIVFHLVVWSLLFEVVGPRLMKGTADVLDVVAYSAGAALCAVWWRRSESSG